MSHVTFQSCQWLGWTYPVADCLANLETALVQIRGSKLGSTCNIRPSYLECHLSLVSCSLTCACPPGFVNT